MIKRLLPALLLAAFLLPARISLGWIDTGHKVIALIAWRDLTEKTRTSVDALLKEHPQYSKYLLANLDIDGGDAVKAQYAFATAATWPDLLRFPSNPMHILYSHPAWHFIDLPVYEGYADPSTRPTPLVQKSDNGEPTNAIEALTWSEKQLKDPSLKASDRAIALCWMEHLVGDIHQPLHAASLFSPAYPTGDRGGNAEWILNDPPYPSSAEDLHLYWDELPGDFKSQLMDGFIASGVRNDPDLSREKLKPLLAVTDYMAWAKESHSLAESAAYENGRLDTAKAGMSRRPDRGTIVPGLSAEYEINAEHVAAHQVALAGYRLADVLNRIFDPAAP